MTQSGVPTDFALGPPVTPFQIGAESTTPMISSSANNQTIGVHLARGERRMFVPAVRGGQAPSPCRARASLRLCRSCLEDRNAPAALQCLQPAYWGCVITDAPAATTDPEAGRMGTAGPDNSWAAPRNNRGPEPRHIGPAAGDAARASSTRSAERWPGWGERLRWQQQRSAWWLQVSACLETPPIR